MSKLQQRLGQLIENQEWKELEELLLNTEDEWILEIVERKMRGSHGWKWIGGMLTALSCSTRESTALRLKIYEMLLKEARNDVRNDHSAGGIVGVLMLHSDAFPTHTLLSLVDQYVEFMQGGEILQGRWVFVLPKLIMNLSQKESLNVDGKEMSGDDYRYQILKTLCDLPWPVETAISLLSVFRDLDLPKEELQDVIYKVERVLKKAEYQSVPLLIYHLILLVQNKLPGRILQIIIEYFNKQEKKLLKDKDTDDRNANSMDIDCDTIEDGSHSALTESQGTVIFHITDLSQNHPELVRDFLKFVKSSTWLTERLITPFNVALSLSLASIEKYEDQVLESLKSCILKYYRQEELTKQSQWLRESWEENCHITTAFKTTIDNCIMAWDQVSQSMVLLAFKLLESGGGPKAKTYPSQRVVSLGSVILPLILKKQPHLATAILSKISNFIISATSPLPYIDIMGKLVKVSPLLLLDHSNLIQEQLEYLSFLPLTAAIHLLQALLPLFKMSMALKDSLMMILRKMLFSKQVESRQVAVNGFMQFLRHFRVMGTLPSSQASMSFSSSLSTVSVNADVHSVFNNSTNEALCLELLGVLRRCFSQQSEVKSVLYSGMYDVCRSNPKLIVSILELLHNQSKQYLDIRPIMLNPIILKNVVVVQGDSVKLTEPIGDLLSCLGACKVYFEEHRQSGSSHIEEDDDDEDAAVTILNDVCSLFDGVIEKLAGCGLDDLGLDPKGEFVLGTTVGEKNVMCATAMAGVFDSLIEYTFCQDATTLPDKMRTVILLFKSLKKIIDLVKERSVKPNKKDGSKGKGRTPNKASVALKSKLRLSVTAKMLSASLCTDETNDVECVEILKGNHELQMYLLCTIEDAVTTVKGLSTSEREKILPHLKTIARVLLQECTENIAPEDSSDDRHIQRLRQSLNILSSLISIFCKYYDNKLETILKDMNKKSNASDVNNLLHRIYKKCQKMILRILNHEDREPLLKDVCTVFQIMSTVSQSLEPECNEVTEAQSWILQLCKDQELEVGTVAESMMTLLFKLSDQYKANHTLARTIGRELHFKFGDLEEGVNVEEVGKFKVVSEATASSVLTIFVGHIDESLNCVELLINKTKACLATGQECNNDEIEKSLCTKCTVVIHAVHEIIQSALPLGSNIDATLKVVSKLYNVLSLYVRYYLELFRIKHNCQISDKFERLVHTSGEMLSAQIYSTITYIEGAQKQGGKKNEGALISRTIKESKLIPSLIFAIEQYEKYLIALSKKSKVNLMQAMKLSTSRDFRIVTAAVTEAFRDEEDDEEGQAEEINENDSRESVAAADEDDGDSGAENDEVPACSGNQGGSDVKKSKVIEKKAAVKRKDTGDENDANSQNKMSQPSAKRSKLGKKK